MGPLGDLVPLDTCRSNEVNKSRRKTGCGAARVRLFRAPNLGGQTGRPNSRVAFRGGDLVVPLMFVTKKPRGAGAFRRCGAIAALLGCTALDVASIQRIQGVR